MTTIHVEIPNSLHDRASELARRDGISLEQLIASALAEKMSALDAEQYLAQRAARGDRAEFSRILSDVPARPPLPGDERAPQ
jgi:hypothetical protein